MMDRTKLGYDDPMKKKDGLKAKLIIIVTITVVVTWTLIIAGILLQGFNSDMERMIAEGQNAGSRVLEKAHGRLDLYENLTGYMAADIGGAKSAMGVKSKTMMMASFKNLMATTPGLMNVYLGSSDGGMYLVPEQDLPSDYDPRIRPWYQAAVKTQKCWWSDTYLDASTNKLIISSAGPVYDASGKTLGVLGMDIELDEFKKEVQAIQVGKTGYVAVADRQGNIVVAKDENLIGKPIPIEALMLAVKKDANSVIQWSQTERDGKKHDKVASVIKDPKLGWSAIAVMDQEEAGAASREVAVKVALAGLLALFVLSLVISRLIRDEQEQVHPWEKQSL